MLLGICVSVGKQQNKQASSSNTPYSAKEFTQPHRETRNSIKFMLIYTCAGKITTKQAEHNTVIVTLINKFANNNI